MTHTDTATLNPADLSISIYPEPRGGMQVGMPRGVAITHKPTGISVVCDSERSQHRNRDLALAALAEKVAKHPKTEWRARPGETPAAYIGRQGKQTRALLLAAREALGVIPWEHPVARLLSDAVMPYSALNAEAPALQGEAPVLIGYGPAPDALEHEAEDWTTPTTYLRRFGDAMALLCGGKRPSDEVLTAWLDTDADDMRLQEFAVEHGPAWAQGIGLIDAARTMADQPTEGVEHEQAPEPARDEEIEAVIACLGDDAAALRTDNPEDERAANMERAAELLGARTTPQITVDFKQAAALLELFGDEPGEITLMAGAGHSGEGLYAIFNADPDGAVYLGQTDDDARPEAPSEDLPPMPPVHDRRNYRDEQPHLGLESDNDWCDNNLAGLRWFIDHHKAIRTAIEVPARTVDAGPADEVARIVHLRTDRARRIYIAGPMTGLPGYNFDAFNAKAAELRAEGWHVENPAEHGHIDGATWADYLRWDISRIATCGAIFLLPGWQDSKGASLEVVIGKALGVQFLGEPVTDAAPLAWVVECKVGRAWVPQWPARFKEADALLDMDSFKTPFKRVTPLVPDLGGRA